jgi:hypothetical protein
MYNKKPKQKQRNDKKSTSEQLLAIFEQVLAILSARNNAVGQLYLDNVVGQLSLKRPPPAGDNIVLCLVSGYKYVQSFIDGRTRLKYIYLLKKKSDAGGALRDFIVKLEREHDCLAKSVHADNAAEFTGGDFNSCLREQGIKFTSSAPYSPESN